MAITLSDGTTTVALPETMLWADEMDWSPVRQTVTPTITGALSVQRKRRPGNVGRPITLTPAVDDNAWISRAVLDQCMAWAADDTLVLTLSLRGVAHQVIWRLQDKAIEASPVDLAEDVQAADDYRATLRLMEV